MMQQIMKNVLRFFVVTLVLSVTSISSMAQVYPPEDCPKLEFVMQLRVLIDQPYSVGDTPHGHRVVVPITGGTFDGPQIKGTVLAGGADYQLVNGNGKRTELEAIYSICTDDSICIHVRNRGIIVNDNDASGGLTHYFMTAPQFEAPQSSRYSWLNDAIFVCRPEGLKGFNGIVLNVWRVM